MSTFLGLIENYYIVYKLNPRTNSCNIALENFDTGRYKYQGYGIGFDLSGIFSHTDGGSGKTIASKKTIARTHLG